MKELVFTGANCCLETAHGYTFLPADIWVKDGRIFAIGDQQNFPEEIKRRKVNGFLYPGFRDPHGHLFFLGTQMLQVQLSACKSIEELVERVKTHAEDADGWVLGRGWNETRWTDKGKNWDSEVKNALDAAFPDRPVYLTRVDQHAALVNSEALKLIDTKEVSGGEVVCKQGKPTGLLIDAAMQLVSTRIPALSNSQKNQAWISAQQKCVQQGLTSITDCGLYKTHWDQFISLQDEGKLFLPVNGMLLPDRETEDFFRKHGPLEKGNLKLKYFKYFADGALGSRGARLHKSYSDADTLGLWMHDPAYLKEQASKNRESGFGMAVHAIGDAAASLVLDLYANYAPGDKYWRMEHCQILKPGDERRFSETGTVPSIQTAHAVSDRNMAPERIGERMDNAYRAKTLLEDFGWLVNGSDFPIEPPDPLRNFYTAVYRREPGEGNEVPAALPAESLTPEDALRAMTRWDARLNSEEDFRASIEPGKAADFTILDTNILEDSPENVGNAKVLQTIIGGTVRFEH